MLASLLVPWLPVSGQTITNAGFEANTFTVFPGYTSGNGPITGWSGAPADRIGINSASGPFANNGTIPEGVNAAFIQAGTSGPASLSTTVTGLTPGTTYKVSMRINARYHANTNLPNLVFSSDGTGPAVALEVRNVANVNDATPYKTAAFEFTATAAEHVITLTNSRTTGDHTVVIDDVSIAPSDGAWSFAPWTGDADSGIDSQYVYTHAYSFGSNPPVTINGVNFIGREGGVAGRFTLNQLNAGFANRTPNNVTGDSANLAKDFRYGGPTTEITLDNLKPDTDYVFTIYGIGFDAAPTNRSATFSSSVPGSQKLSVNLNHYGQGNGILVNYTYTTDSLGTPVTISYPTHGSGSFHTSGFSNREAVPSTPPVVWSVEPWFDDATSGVSPNHVYTHAVNFGSATGLNLNGINFTGVAGANPATANLTVSGMPAQYANDTNNVTGYGAPMAKDFLYDGFPGVYDLTGLTPGKDYVFTLYTVGWNDGYRPAAVIGGTGEQATILNQDEYGDNQGLRFEYQYTANAAGTAKITVSGFDGGKSIHTYGISNREADAMVGVAPSITLQPTGASLGTGSPFVLRVGATGSETLSYQWKLDGSDIGGATDPVLDLGFVDFSNAGDYTVVISNSVDSVESDVATLVVLENVPGAFSSGVGPDGFPLAGGQIDPHFTLIVNPDNPGSDTVYVQSNVPGSWNANSGTSKWIGPRADTSGAAAMAADDGEGAGTYVYRTTVDLTGFDLATVKIQGSWASDNLGNAIRVNDAATGITNVDGDTFGILRPFVIDTSNAPGLIAGVNNIDFVVNNSDAATGFTGLRIEGLSAIGVIPPNTPPHIAIQPVGGNGPHGGTFVMSVAASGSAPLSYQWYKGTDPIEFETEPVLYVDIFDLSAAGDYKVVVSNGFAPDAESSVATVIVTNENPVVVDDDVETDQDTPLEIDVLFDMLANDTDADGDAPELASFSGTSFNGGTVTEDLGIITYTPAPGFTGLDGFTYTVSDGWGGTSAAGTVLITVNAVAVGPPGQLELTVDLGGGSVNGSFTGTPGATYILQRSTTLTGVWDDIDTVVAPGSGIVEVVDNDPPAGKAFYRISYAE
ncbi:Ig-like domain-containing protein [Luteolibacter marinus]|uniref:Ig-like domain-containing protein n=1 Tax=Luteolibacter marinus TaxID=2776705 RepID=UPI0018667F43|nr:Ig-like domain-containing protein [Luteolibacter marinus]